MKVLTPGHKYELDNHEEGGEKQVIQFIEKEQIGGEFVTINNGTTNEEVLTMLMDRIESLDKKVESVENRHAFIHLEFALSYLKIRTKDRQDRGVEGTGKA